MKPMTTIGTLVVSALLLSACAGSGSAGTVPPLEPTPEPSIDRASPDLTPGASPPGPTETIAPETNPPASSEPAGSPGPTATPAAEGTTIVRAYFYLESVPGSSGLVPVLREIPATRAVASAAMTALLNGPTENESGAMSSAIPAGSRLLGLAIKDGVATVDLSSEFESGGGSASVITRLGQVVFTLTQFPTVKSVLFKIEGRTVTVFSSEGIVLDGPSVRADYDDVLPAIFVDRPAYGAALGNPGRVAGSSNVFEATFRVTLRDAGGQPIADQQIMATCGSGCRGTFDVTVSYDVGKAQWGTLRVWDGSAKDGSPENVREYPVWLTPG
jgi:germination protein M